MNKKFLLSLFSMFLLLVSVIHADFKDGEYPVKVAILKEYEDDYSMGNNAMLPDATLYVSGGTARLRVNFVPLETMGFTGYLGALWVNGTPATVISTYDEIDEYNDSETGIDERMIGQKYPRTLEFTVDLNNEIQPCTVYVPAMAEFGDGEQNARIKITYPEGFAEEPVISTEENVSERSEEISQKQEPSTSPNDSAQDDNKGEKYYTVPIKLWHSVEDRESMGNGSMTNEANIYSKDGKMTLYIASNQMTVSTITASLINLYYDNGTEFVKATPYSYNMKIDGFTELRPEVFSMPLKNKDEYLFVMVDPKVEPMGDDPIKARFKFDFANMKEINKADAKLIKLAEHGKAKPQYDASKEYTKTDKGISIDVPAGSFQQDYTFYANQIRGEELNKYKKDFDSLAIIKAYKLSALGTLDTIPYDAKRPINDLRESFQPKNPVTITLPIEESAIDVKLYAIDGETKSELEFTQNADTISFEYNKFVPFILVYKKDMQAKNVTDTKNRSQVTSNNTAPNTPAKNTVKDLLFNVSKVKTYENKMFITFYIILLFTLLSVSIYVIQKYYKKLKNELYYAEFLKLKLEKQNLLLINKMANEEEE